MFCRMSRHDSWTYTVLLSTVFVVYLRGGVSELICPEVAGLDSSVLLTCTSLGPAGILYIQPNGTSTAAICYTDRCVSSQSDRFNGTVVNMTHSYLEIKKAQLLDEGNWKCRDTTINITSNCSLILRKTPSCSITSYQNTENLTIGDKVTLTIHVKDYYCSAPSGILLQTGHVLEDVVKDQRTDSITTNSFNATFNVTKSHIGSLEILHTCNGISQKINCDGIHVLLEKQVKTLQFSDGVPYEKPQYNIVLIAGIAAGAVIAVIVIVIVVYVVKKRKSQKTSEANEDKDNEMTENVNGRSKNITLSAFGAYEDIGDVNSTFGNQRAVKESTECNGNMESFQNQGYMSGEELRLERTESWNPHKSEDQPEARPLYTQVNKKPKPNT